MAKVTNKQFTKKGGRRPKYPWQVWLDGRQRELTPGSDFRTTIESMENLIRITAKRRGIKVSVFHENGRLYVQAMLAAA